LIFAAGFRHDALQTFVTTSREGWHHSLNDHSAVHVFSPAKPWNHRHDYQLN